MSHWTPRLSDALDNLDRLFHRNELAYLALTQKVEHVIRDRLAFSLHCSWAETDGVLVCREWKRIDLAVVKDSSPLVLLEAKAVYSFNVLTQGTPHSYPDMMVRDIQKVASRRSEETDVFALLLVTHPHAAPDPRYRHAVKYFPYVARHACQDIPLREAEVQIEKRFPGHPRAASGEIDGGVAFGVPVSVAYWLFGPYPTTL